MNSNIVCSKCILDTTIEEIEFDSNGVCNYCHTHEMMEKKFPLGQEGDATVNKIVAKIKEKGKKYDMNITIIRMINEINEKLNALPVISV